MAVISYQIVNKLIKRVKLLLRINLKKKSGFVNLCCVIPIAMQCTNSLCFPSVITNARGTVSITPIKDAKTFVNGNLVSEPTVLHHVSITRGLRAEFRVPGCSLRVGFHTLSIGVIFRATG